MTEFDPAHVDRGGAPHRYPGGPLEVTKLHVGPYENNAYLLRDPETNDGLLVDAANEAERLLNLLEGVRLVGIVTTHRHPDHIQALAGVLKAHDVWNGAHPA
ncbi:MAG TPA: MBL fold metallo-hydrolase, partial [Actinomycetes bacterium]|nr:MBL fold metallo-hydrolase [Actinomycetes bacterium]